MGETRSVAEIGHSLGLTMMKHRLLATLTASALLVGTSLLKASVPPQQGAPQTAAAPSLLSATDQQFTGDGVTLRYRDVGKGDPIVLIHGYSASLESMAGIAGALPQEHRMVALDVRGFGRSTKFADPARFGEEMVRDVTRLMDHLKIERAHLIGHSMGALIAANVAARYPDRVSSAVLVAGPFYADESTFNREASRWTADLESGKGLTNFLLWLFPAFKPEMAAGFNAQVMKVNDLGSLTAVMRSLPKLAIAGLSKDGEKILLIAGTGDPLFPLSTAFAKQSRGARLIEIDGADHMNVITHAAAVAAIRAQLQR
jgi:pimeloyl-ACP methyl ester carboxylesterase